MTIQNKTEGEIKVALFGATGYSGREAARLISAHPHFELAAVFGGREREGVPLSRIHPSLRSSVDLVCSGLNGDRSIDAAVGRLARSNVGHALLATPEPLSLTLAPRLLKAGLRVIDLSGAFRLRTASDYPVWYGFDHAAPALLDGAAYGLSEWADRSIAAADLVANPGCYPTAALLALLPLRETGLIDLSSAVVIHAASGASGAGRQLREDLLFCEIDGSIRPYGHPRHRHLAEIASRVDLVPGSQVVFVPHLAPLDRGLLCSISLRLREGVGPTVVAEAFERAYAGAPFVRLLEEGVYPSTAEVAGTNSCAIGWNVDAASGQMVVFAAIDNLVKGAAGQAVQNLNLMTGRPVEEGLPR